MRYLIVLLLTGLTAGCGSLKEKGLPSEQIITTFDSGTHSTGRAVNELTDSFTAFGSKRLDGAKVQLQVKEGAKLRRYAEKILLDSRRAVNFTQVSANPDYIVTASFVELTPDVFDWRMSLASANSPGTVLWRHSVKVDTYKID